MSVQSLQERVAKLQDAARDILSESGEIQSLAKSLMKKVPPQELDPFIIGLTVFALACFVGYYVVWKVTPALHSPLMSVTNAISSVIIVGALLAAGPTIDGFSTTFGFFAVVLASINIFGGFIVTQRMLAMFSKSK